MGFIILLALSTLSIAGSAAYFSVVGLARVFSGAFWSIICMGTALEAGKLVTASYLYRYWRSMSKAMRAYLLTAVLILMGITSMGIFGYLSSAFQNNILPYQQQSQQIQLLEADKAEAEKLKTERLNREEEINKQIANLPSDYVTGRKKLMESNKEELDQIRTDVTTYTTQIRDYSAKISVLKSKVLEETTHVGPIIFIAEVFGADVTQATKWLFALIVLVFDPLAVILTVGLNVAILKHKNEKLEPSPPSQLVPVSSSKELLTEPLVNSSAVDDSQQQEVTNKPDPPVTMFTRANDLFSNPDLTPHEQAIGKSLEDTITRYLRFLGK